MRCIDWHQGRKETTHSNNTSKPDGSLASNKEESFRLMLEYFIPEYNHLDGNNLHKYITKLTDKQPNTPDHREFTREDFGRVIEGMEKKMPRGKKE